MDSYGSSRGILTQLQRNQWKVPDVLPLHLLCTCASCPPVVQDDGKAKALLQRMLSDDVRAAVLERLESMDPARAASCRALLAAPAAAEAKHAEVAGADTAPAEEQQQQQQQQEVEDAQQQAAPALATQQRGRGSRRAAAVKRPASAELSAGEDTEEETASEASRCLAP
jgi:hypothetical protein